MGNCVGEVVGGGAVFYSYLVSLIGFIHESVQHVTLVYAPVNVLPRLFLWFSQVKHLECHDIEPPQEVQCVHMYSVAWDALVICTNHYLTETRWELGRGGGGAVCGSWGELEKVVGGGGGAVLGAVSQHCGESNAGEVCMWEELCGGSCVGEAVGELCWRSCGGAVFHSCL